MNICSTHISYIVSGAPRNICLLGPHPPIATLFCPFIAYSTRLLPFPLRYVHSRLDSALLLLILGYFLILNSD